MIQRVKQFYRAVTAQITPEDRQWVKESLPPAAQKLFYAMHPADQYHALNVAKTAMKLWERQQTGDRALLLRAALLHDIGKKRGDMDIMGKVWAVLLKHYFPAKAQQLGKADNGWLSHILYISYQHPAIGAAKLEEIGMTAEATIICSHHRKKMDNDPPELALLQAADELN